MSSWVGIDVSKNTLAVWVRPSGVNFIVCACSAHSLERNGA